MDISIVALSIVLFGVLIAASIQDLMTQKVDNIFWVLVACLSIVIMVQNNLDIDSVDKIIMLALLGGYILALWVGGSYFVEKGFYGGADIKMALALTPLLASIEVFGLIFIGWFLVLNPLVNSFAKKKDSGAPQKFAFIPWMSLTFIVLYTFSFWK